MVLKCQCKRLKVLEVKSKPKALQHFKVDPVLKIDDSENGGYLEITLT